MPLRETEMGVDTFGDVTADAAARPQMVKVMAALGLSRFDLKYSAGTLPQRAAQDVAPAVRERLRTSDSAVSCTCEIFHK